MEEIKRESESINIYEYSTNPSQFRVAIQPKFTLENVEAFVCSSQVNICQEGETIGRQCTFEDGRQANVCWKKEKHNIPTLRVGKLSDQLDVSFEVPRPFRGGLLRSTKEGQNGLSGIGNNFSILDGDTDYSFENHWSTRSRDDYDFHAEFNIRKDGKIVESHRCLETNYD